MGAVLSGSTENVSLCEPHDTHSFRKGISGTIGLKFGNLVRLEGIEPPALRSGVVRLSSAGVAVVG